MRKYFFYTSAFAAQCPVATEYQNKRIFFAYMTCNVAGGGGDGGFLEIFICCAVIQTACFQLLRGERR